MAAHRFDMSAIEEERARRRFEKEQVLLSPAPQRRPMPHDRWADHFLKVIHPAVLAKQ